MDLLVFYGTGLARALVALLDQWIQSFGDDKDNKSNVHSILFQLQYSWNQLWLQSLYGDLTM